MSNRCRLYLITPNVIDDLDAYAEACRAAFGAGDIACLQVRLKSASDEEILRATEKLLPIVQRSGANLLINDRPDLADKSGADGVHVGQSDASCRNARKLLGDEAVVGVTCHNSVHLAMEAGEDGADYVAFGAFFPTETKEASTRATPDILEWWSNATVVPSVAIGGITPENCGPLVEAGADFLAVSAAIWGDADGPEAAIEKFNHAIARHG